MNHTPAVLIACECSGAIRREMRRLGADACSCDLQDAEDGSPHHIKGDALAAIRLRKWDGIIAHPVCTFLCNSGVRWLAPGGIIDADRYARMVAACDFFAALYWADCPCVGVENPVMHGHARDYLARRWNVPAFSFSLQPWQHGEPEKKRSCFWTRGLPALVPSNIVPGPYAAKVHRMSPGPNRARERSRTLPGVAKAIAEQWGPIFQQAAER